MLTKFACCLLTTLILVGFGVNSLLIILLAQVAVILLLVFFDFSRERSELNESKKDFLKSLKDIR